MAINDRDTTLGDLNRLDRDNFAHAMKKAKTYKTPTAKAAQLLMGQCFDRAMRKCGVKVRPGMDGSEIAQLMIKKEVKVEHRVYDPKEEDLYQTGLYIYSKKEIAGFISSPFEYQGKIDLAPAFYVRTTVEGV